ncbi:MAG: serine/threonine protein kinase [Planctomycetia bacterium]|nr:serine/threonine protein kinase [Planctomycetia bacterium]
MSMDSTITCNGTPLDKAFGQIQAHLRADDAIEVKKQSIQNALSSAKHPIVLDEAIGRGGQALVFRARHKRTGGSEQTVAIKVFLQNTNTALDEQFQAEVKSLSQLSHEGIIRLYDEGTAPPYAFIVMEFLPDGHIGKFVNERVRDPRTILDLIQSICNALHTAHSRPDPIVHRDIKPGNILMRGNSAVLADFALAALGRESTLGFAGTVAYASPEQLDSAKEVDATSDIWALGVVLHELLTGLPLYSLSASGDPADQRRLIEAFHATEYHLLKYSGWRGSEIASIIKKCVAPSRLERYRNASDLGADLKRLLRGGVVLAHGAGLHSAWQQKKYAIWARLRRHPIRVGVVLVATIVGGLGLYAIDTRRNQMETEWTAESRRQVAIAQKAVADAERRAKDEARRVAILVVETYCEGIRTASHFRNDTGTAHALYDQLENAERFLALDTGEHPDVTSQLQHEVGVQYKNLRRYEKAVEHLEAVAHVWPLCNSLGEPCVDAITVRAEMADAYRHLGECEQAFLQLRELYEFTALNPCGWYPLLDEVLVCLYNDADEYQLAVDKCTAALQCADKVADDTARSIRARFLKHLGYSYFCLANRGMAYDAYALGLQEAERAGFQEASLVDYWVPLAQLEVSVKQNRKRAESLLYQARRAAERAYGSHSMRLAEIHEALKFLYLGWNDTHRAGYHHVMVQRTKFGAYNSQWSNLEGYDFFTDGEGIVYFACNGSRLCTYDDNGRLIAYLSED